MTRLAALALAAALLAADAALSMGEWLAWQELAPRAIALELVAAIAVLAVIGRWAPRAATGVAWLLAALLCAGMALRLTDLTVRFLFARFFDPVFDLKFVPLILDMQRQSSSTAMVVLTGAAIAAGIVIVVWLVRRLLGAAAAAAARGRWRPFALAAVPCLIGAVSGWPHDEDWVPLTWKIGGTVTRLAHETINVEATRRARLAEIETTRVRRPAAVAFEGLQHRDVVLVFVESYGAVTYAKPEFAALLGPVRARFAARTEGAGYQVMTGLLDSPITGGGSWMAHGAMQAGFRIADQGFYNLVLGSRAMSLSRYFAGAGWRSVSVMPRMHGLWPEGAFFGFDAHYDDAALGWQGPRYTIQTIPDQAVLEQVVRRELGPGRTRPSFLQIVLASSHSPFDLVPPVLTDWGGIGDGTAYAGTEPLRFPIRNGRLMEQDDGYAAAIAYDIEALGRWLAERLEGNGLVILVGDHQPPLASAAATRDKGVVMHVLSRDGALLAPFARAGFQGGMQPAAGAVRLPMDGFLDFFLAAYGGATRAVARR